MQMKVHFFPFFSIFLSSYWRALGAAAHPYTLVRLSFKENIKNRAIFQSLKKHQDRM